LGGGSPPASLQGLGIESAEDVQDLTMTQRAALYRWYVDSAMPALGAWALNDLGDRYTAAAVEDALFEQGPGEGVRLVQEAINDVIKDLPSAELTALGVNGLIPADSVLGSRTFAALAALANGGYGAILREALANWRDIELKGNERWRTDYFRYRGG
jgi:hypothetical protein